MRWRQSVGLVALTVAITSGCGPPALRQTSTRIVASPKVSPSPSPSPIVTPTPTPTISPRAQSVKGRHPAVAVQAAPSSASHPQQVAAAKLAERGWAGHWGALNALVRAESGWNPRAVNRRSGACGLFQRLPCRGMHLQPVEVQVENGLGYIAGRYGNPSAAWAAFRRKGWY